METAEIKLKVHTPEHFNAGVKELLPHMSVLDAILAYCENNDLEYETVDKNVLKLYHNDLDVDKLKNNNIICIAGHTHCSYDFEKNGVRYISNQKGYSNNFKKNQAKLKFDGNFTLF